MQHLKRKRAYWAATSLGIAGILAFVWGESGSGPGLLLQGMAAAGVAMFATFWLWPGRVGTKAAFAVASAGTIFGALLLGTASFAAAFNECMVAGERVRENLAAYRTANGYYPASLNQVMVSAPCSRLLLPSLLNYRKTATGYVLSFSDWLAAHTANESSPFQANQ